MRASGRDAPVKSARIRAASGGWPLIVPGEPGYPSSTRPGLAVKAGADDIARAFFFFKLSDLDETLISVSPLP